MRLFATTILILCVLGCGNADLEERVADLEYEVYHLRARIEALESRSQY